MLESLVESKQRHRALDTALNLNAGLQCGSLKLRLNAQITPFPPLDDSLSTAVHPLVIGCVID